jgi:pyrroline-5-carboxylate reductase
MRIGFIGAGQMARALASGFVRQDRVSASNVTSSDCSEAALATFQELLPDTRVTTNNREVVASSDIVFLAVKPQHLPPVFEALPTSNSPPLFVSIIAGVPLTTLSSALGTDRVIRVMPNTPCLIGQGASAFCRGSQVTDEDAQTVNDLLSAVGTCRELSEPLLDVVTGLSGSGPAFVFLFIEALSDGGVKMGLPRDVAQQLAAQTVHGAAQMVLKSGDHPAVLKDRVASPAGTTIAGIHALEQNGIRAAAIAAVEAATRRSQELGRQ